MRQVGNFSALFECEITVIFPGVDDLGGQSAFEQVAEAFHDVEYQIFFEQALPPDAAQIPTAVAGIEHDA